MLLSEMLEFRDELLNNPGPYGKKNVIPMMTEPWSHTQRSQLAMQLLLYSRENLAFTLLKLILIRLFIIKHI